MKNETVTFEFHGIPFHNGTTSRSPSVQLRPGAGS